MPVPRALTIATSDSGGEAGIQADLEAFAAAGAQGPGTFHARLYDALYELDPDSLDARTRIEDS